MISVSDSKDVIPKHTGGYMYIRHTNCHGDGGVMVNNFENGINKTYTFSSTITSISAFFFTFGYKTVIFMQHYAMSVIPGLIVL